MEEGRAFTIHELEMMAAFKDMYFRLPNWYLPSASGMAKYNPRYAKT